MKKNKEHKKGESTIGKIIYGFLLFMPLFAIGVTCGYAMFNKNAYHSYSGLDTSTTYEEIQPQNISYNQEIVSNFTFSNVGSTNGNSFLYLNNFAVINTNLNITQDLSATRRIEMYINNSNLSGLYFKDENATTIATYYPSATSELIISYNYESFVNAVNTTAIDFNTRIINNGTQIDNVFYYAVDKVTESPLFNWATNSVIYTTMNATCTQLSITAPFIPLLLSYWLIISVIYFLYDIALMLIWLLHDKIHEMRDSLA